LGRVGLPDSILVSVADIYQGRTWLYTDGFEHDGNLSYRKGILRALETFNEIQENAEQDIKLLFDAEYTYIEQELKYCVPRDKKATNSLTKAVAEFDDAFLILEVLQNPKTYISIEKAFAHRDAFRYRGMPKDAFHVACSAHITRLDNNLKTPGINIIEKDLLIQRIKNMEKAQAVYLQKKITVIGKR
jgi:hypothetical protein